MNAFSHLMKLQIEVTWNNLVTEVKTLPGRLKVRLKLFCEMQKVELGKDLKKVMNV